MFDRIFTLLEGLPEARPQSRAEEQLARLSTRGRHLVAANSGHWIPLDEPLIVVDAVRSLLEGDSGNRLSTEN